jgi:hypothetical protein
VPGEQLIDELKMDEEDLKGTEEGEIYEDLLEFIEAIIFAQKKR